MSRATAPRVTHTSASPTLERVEPSTARSSPPVTFEELPRRQVIATLAGVMSAMLLAALDQTIVGTAMPRVVAELHGFEHYAWVLTAYLVTSTAVVPIAGKLSDLFGRRFFLLSGVAIFVLASALCGASQTMPQLVVFRGLQGVGAGFTQAMAFTTMADLFPPARRGRVAGLMGAVFGFASVIGPAIGGLLTDGPGWRWIFYVNLPLGLLSLGILFFYFPKVRQVHTTRPRIDILGCVTLLLAVVPLLLALSWGGREYGWNSPLILALLVFAMAMSAAFVFIEAHAAEPIIPLSLFQNRVVATCVAAASLVAVGMFVTLLFVPLWIQGVIGTSATQSGAVLTPMMFGMIASSILAGQIITRIGRYRVVGLVGISLSTVAMGLLAMMDASTDYATVIRNMLLVGLGLGSTMPVMTLAVQNAIEQRQVGTATSTMQFFRQMGGAIGAAVFGSVLATRFVPALQATLPSEVASQLTPAHVEQLNNPQVLLSPDAGAAMQDSMAAIAPQAQAIVFDAIRAALASSLHDVFVLSTIVMACGVVIAFFVKDLPLRTTNNPGRVQMSEHTTEAVVG